MAIVWTLGQLLILFRYASATIKVLPNDRLGSFLLSYRHQCCLGKEDHLKLLWILPTYISPGNIVAQMDICLPFDEGFKRFFPHRVI